MTYSRRDLCLLVSALAATPAIAAPDAALKSNAYPYAGLPVHKSGENEFRPILSGDLHDGHFLEVHETRLAPGQMPHPAHRHVHEEMFLVKEGTIEVTINGRATQLGPGSAGFAASGDEHGIQNNGSIPAEYFVVAMGKDA